MVSPALQAAELLAAEGVEVAVLDLRWLRPLDEAAILQAVENSGGDVVIAHEAFTHGGFGAEVSARITEKRFNLLRGPILRVGTPDVRMPSAPALQALVVPSTESIVQAVRQTINAEYVREFW